MKILLLGNYEHDLQDSMQRFNALMVRGLTEAGQQVRSLRPPALLGRIHPSSRGVGKWLGYIDKYLVFPLVLRSAMKWADVVHICDQANSVYTKYLKSFPHVVTCHDMLAIRSAKGEMPQNRTSWTGRTLQGMILRGLTDAQHIVCVSEATRKDVLRIVQIPEQRVSRVYNSLPYPYSYMEEREARCRVDKLVANLQEPFLLHVGGNQWYKNRLGVLRIFAAFRKLVAGQDFKLLMVGKPWTPEMRQFATEHKLGTATVELTGVSDEDLRALYSTATLMLFPSLQEGFGWPIIEAQACGCPVLTSCRSPMDEVGGDAAIYCNPEDPDTAAGAVEDALGDLAGFRDRSFRNAARFDTSTMIESYVLLYQKLCDRNSHRPPLN